MRGAACRPTKTLRFSLKFHFQSSGAYVTRRPHIHIPARRLNRLRSRPALPVTAKRPRNPDPEIHPLIP